MTLFLELPNYVMTKKGNPIKKAAGLIWKMNEWYVEVAMCSSTVLATRKHNSRIFNKQNHHYLQLDFCLNVCVCENEVNEQITLLLLKQLSSRLEAAHVHLYSRSFNSINKSKIILILFRLYDI